jgi:1,4-alpha-glucan branching enzyme
MISTPSADAVNATSERTGSSGVTAFEVTPGRDRQRALRVYAPTARVVEVNADFTQWQARRLTRGSDGWWSVTVPLAPGTYQMNVRVDGGGWLVPPGLTTVVDEFGGAVGVLVIE